MIELKNKPVERPERKLTIISNHRRIKRRCSNVGRLSRLLNPVPDFRFVKPRTFICDEHHLILFITSNNAVKDKRFEEQIKSCASKNIMFIPIDNRKLQTALRRIEIAVEISKKAPRFKLT